MAAPPYNFAWWEKNPDWATCTEKHSKIKYARQRILDNFHVLGGGEELFMKP